MAKKDTLKLDLSLAISQLHKEMKLKFIGTGAMLLLIGILWAAAEAGAYPSEFFWPSAVGVVGLMFLIKAFLVEI